MTLRERLWIWTRSQPAMALRVPLVLLTTVLTELGYLVLVMAAVLFGHPELQHPPHWPVIVMVVLALEGLAVAYLVHRVSAPRGSRGATAPD
jgi:hypothetical protein